MHAASRHRTPSLTSLPKDRHLTYLIHNEQHVIQAEGAAAMHLYQQYCHHPYAFLQKVLKVFAEKDGEFLHFLKRHSDKCTVFKQFKPAIPQPTVGNLFGPDKMRFETVVCMCMVLLQHKLLLVKTQNRLLLLMISS